MLWLIWQFDYLIITIIKYFAILECVLAVFFILSGRLQPCLVAICRSHFRPHIGIRFQNLPCVAFLFALCWLFVLRLVYGGGRCLYAV